MRTNTTTSSYDINELIKNARDSLVKYDGDFNELYNYNFNYTETTGIYEKWDQNSIELGSICTVIMNGLLGTMKNKSFKLPIYICENFMIRYNEILKTKNLNNKTFPWGNNWYQFSINSTQMLAYYLLLDDVKQKLLASQIILSIIKSPTLSLGYTRDGVNSIYLCGPYILASYYMGKSLDDIYNESSVKYCQEVIKFNTEIDTKLDGLHIDDSYTFHNSVISFSYLITLDTNLCNYMFKLYPLLDSSLIYNVINKYKMITYHPTLNKNNVLGIKGRVNTLSFDTNINSPFGIYLYPTIKYLRYFTNNYTFSVRCQTGNLAFYEADQTVYNTSLYWVQFHGVLNQTSDVNVKFPDFGFIVSDTTNKLIELKSNSTTKTFKPAYADSFVLKFEEYGIAYQKYTINELSGDAIVEELIVINSKTETIQIIWNITTKNTALSFYLPSTKTTIDNYRDNLESIKIDRNSQYQSMVVFNLKNNSVITTKNDTNSISGILTNLNIKPISNNNDSYYIYYTNDMKPKYLTPFKNSTNTKLSDNLIIKNNDELQLFSFDSIENQYKFNLIL